MTRRTYENDAILIEQADDLETLVKDKREIWRSNHLMESEDKEDIKRSS